MFVAYRLVHIALLLCSCSFGFIANTGSAVSKGLDMQIQYALTDAIKLGVSGAYTDARFTKTVTFQGTPLVEAGDAVGSPEGVTAPLSLTTSIEYDFSLAGKELGPGFE